MRGRLRSEEEKNVTIANLDDQMDSVCSAWTF